MWAGIALATVFAMIKTAIRLYVSKRLFIDDLLVYVALMLLVVMGILYTLINETIFEIDMVGMGEMLPPPGFEDNVGFFLRAQFAIIVIFWTTLWAVKLSLLMYYKKLFSGLPGHEQRVWWAVTVFAVLSYIGCWITQLLSCTPISTYFTGECQTPHDIYVSNLSLYYATSVDIICDIFSKLCDVALVSFCAYMLFSYGAAPSLALESAGQSTPEVCFGWNIFPGNIYHNLRNC